MIYYTASIIIQRFTCVANVPQFKGPAMKVSIESDFYRDRKKTYLLKLSFALNTKNEVHDARRFASMQHLLFKHDSLYCINLLYSHQSTNIW